MDKYPSPRKAVPGIRFFVCDECGEIWWDKTRDCLSPSGDHCPNDDCGDFTRPVANHPQPVPTTE
ncbi:hypothetical protein GCM10023116_46430 [Kistimonas scapharcae]|uniref:Uncharacterized protein n=1 Tax=Kistimonas scapharcae TaxID=1036133 RepID=A0ABP8V8R7_9GAMM